MNCNFGDQEDDNIRDQVIDKCVDRRLKGKYLEKGTLTVVQLQEIARAHEAAQWQVKNMEQNSGPGLDHGGEPVGAVSGRNPKKTGDLHQNNQANNCVFVVEKLDITQRTQSARPKERSVTFVPNIFVLFVDLNEQARKTD